MSLHARQSPDKLAIVCDDRNLSWNELDQEVSAAASELAKKIEIFKDQQVIHILLPNGWQFVVAYLAALKLGHMALPLDPAYKKLELDAMIKQIPGIALITDEDYGHQVSAEPQLVISFDELTAGRPQNLNPIRLDAKDQVASITFTSGTTGKPKAVPNTHANHIWNIEACSEVWDWTTDDTLLISLPLSHMHGIVMGLSGVLYHGNTMYLQRWFDAEQTLTALASGKITFFTHAASAYIKLVQTSTKSYDLSAVRLCVSGAAPLPPAVWQEFKDRFGIEILETYGSSETGRIAGNRLNERVLGSPGRPLPGVELRTNQNQELEVKSPGLFPGYYHNPQATKSSLTSDGYWRTGDLVELRNGCLYLKGRVQELIRRFGYTISPRDVEWALLTHPKIKDAYVMGRQQSSEPNDELTYFIVGDVTKAEVTDFSKKNLLFAWRTDRIIILDDLPRTRNGKPKLASLKSLAEEKL